MSGNTPLHEAARSYATTGLEVLLAAGADVNIQNRYGNTPLHMAAVNSFQSAACEMLFYTGADVYIYNNDAETPADILRARNSTNRELYLRMKKMEEVKRNTLSMMFKRARVNYYGSVDDVSVKQGAGNIVDDGNNDDDGDDYDRDSYSNDYDCDEYSRLIDMV